jgi:hypothetical protein
VVNEMNFEDFYIRFAFLEEQLELLEEQLEAMRLDFIEFNARVAGVAPEKIAEKQRLKRLDLE